MDVLNEIGVQRWRLRTRMEERDVSSEDSQKESSIADALVENEPLDQKRLIENSTSNDKSISEAISPSSPESINEVQQKQQLSATVTESNPNDFQHLDIAGIETSLRTGQLCESCNGFPVIMGVGDPQESYGVFVDMPENADEGEVLTGRALQLLINILQALGLSLQDVYLSSARKCDSTKDNGHDSAVPGCTDILDSQLKLMAAKRIVCFGEFSGQTLLRSNAPLAQMRQQNNELHGAAVVVTHDLRACLAVPKLKADVWADLKQFVA